MSLVWPKHERVRRGVAEIISKASAEYDQRLIPVVSFLEKQFHPDEDISEEAQQLVEGSLHYRSLYYRTHDSWSRFRRVVSKVTYDDQGLKLRFVVTSLPASKVPPGKLYTEKYCPRGEMENRIKEQQLELFSDRTSTHNFEGNQLRLWFSSVAYVLLQALREQCLSRTSLANAQVGTIRNKLLKLGARLLTSVRRVLVSLSSSCPYQELFAAAYQRLQKLPAPS